MGHRITHTLHIEGEIVKEVYAASREVEQALKDLEMRMEGFYHVQVQLSEDAPEAYHADMIKRSFGWSLRGAWRLSKWGITELWKIILKETEPAKEEPQT